MRVNDAKKTWSLTKIKVFSLIEVGRKGEPDRVCEAFGPYDTEEQADRARKALVARKTYKRGGLKVQERTIEVDCT